MDWFKGIFGYSLINDFGIDLKGQCGLVLDGSVASVYCVSNQLIRDKHENFTTMGNDPVLIPSAFFQLDSVNLDNCWFLGFVAVHSVNTVQRYFNVYAPNELVGRMRDISEDGEYQFVLVRGRTELSSHEICPKIFMDKREEGIESKKPFNTPFISWDASKGKGAKTWKVRKKVQRRGQVQPPQ